MNIKFRDVSMALLAASVLTLAACASMKKDDATTPPADATPAPASDATTAPPADSAAPASTTTP